MEERKYTFYDRYQKVKYDNVTAEELEVLNTSYNKEHYMFHQQHREIIPYYSVGYSRKSVVQQILLLTEIRIL